MVSLSDDRRDALPAAHELAVWPGDERRHPPRHDRHYLVLSALSEALQAEVARALAGRTGLDVLDIGCGQKPYLPFLAPYAKSYRGIDAVPGPVVDDIGEVEALPYDDDSFDVIVCTQVLEHVEEPWTAVREVARVLRPGGVAFLSTHGVCLYHPDPPELGRDFWRWTHRGLERLLRTNAEWSDITVTPNREVVAAVGYITAQFADEAFQRIGRPRLHRWGLGALNAVAEKVDRKFPPRARGDRPGSMSANYLVTAVRA